MATTVQLMDMDEVVLEADYDREIHAFLGVTRLVAPELAPYGARDASGDVSRRRLQQWWSGRAIPATRDDFARLRDSLGGLTPMDLLEESLGLSLTDQFWVREADDGRSWGDVNFFDNGFGPELGNMTLGSFSPLSRGQAPSASPNSSVGGALRKAWEARPGGPVLVKAGSAPLGLEPLSELAATRLYERLLDPGDYVPYSVEVRDGRLYSACPDMVGRTECLAPMRDVIEARKRRGSESPWTHLLACCDALGIADAETQLAKTFTCDFVLANPDRHWGNLGVIFDARTMSAKRVAPIFDNGAALWSRVASLEADVDFWYRPLPLIPERSRRTWPEDQLRLMHRFSWADFSRLRGFSDELFSILMSAPAADERRCESIRRRVERNVEVAWSVACRSEDPPSRRATGLER